MRFIRINYITTLHFIVTFLEKCNNFFWHQRRGCFILGDSTIKHWRKHCTNSSVERFCKQYCSLFWVFVFLVRIVAARLNGSLDFFTVEINKPLGLLQYRGEAQTLLWVSLYLFGDVQLPNIFLMLTRGKKSLFMNFCIFLPLWLMSFWC